MSAASAKCTSMAPVLPANTQEMTALCVRIINIAQEPKLLLLTVVIVSGKCAHNFHMVGSISMP